jgi:mannose-6-phosphate isomerase-like protein (cupin superfamily)
MSIIRHRDRPELLFPEEPWRLPFRFAVNRETGANNLSIWLHYYSGERRAPLHWHDTEEVLIFLDVDGPGFVWLGDREYPVESDCSVVVPPNTVHCFGLHGPGSMRTISVLPDADARPGPRIYQVGEEPSQLPSPDQWPTRAHPGYAGERQR